MTTTVWLLSFALMISCDGSSTFTRQTPALEGVYRSEAGCLARGDEVEKELFKSPLSFAVTSCTPLELQA
jgi:hypothetical protein